MDVLTNVATVIRTYNNNRDSRKTILRALNNGVGLVVVVVNGHDEHMRGRVERDISNLKEEFGERIVLIEMQQGYTWANALNIAFSSIRCINRVKELCEEQEIEYVVTCSVETLWERKTLDNMLSVMHKSRRTGVVGTSFDGRLDGNSVDLGTSYVHPRNTFMLIRWSTFENVGHFNAICDSFGGMEDLFFVMSMVLFEGLEWHMLDEKVRLILGKHHDQTIKEQRERSAMDKIISYFETMCAGAPTEVKQRMNRMLKAFGLLA